MLSRSVMSDSYGPMDCSLLGSSVHGDSPGKNTGLGCHALLQGIFPTQGLNPDLWPCRQILYHLSHQGSPPYAIRFSPVQLLSRVQLFATPWTAARQASLSITNSQSWLKPMSTELVMPSSHLILDAPFSSYPQSLPAAESFPVSRLFAPGGQSTGASASLLPVNIQR